MYFVAHTSKKRGFALNFLTPQNASKFAMFIEKENPCTYLVFCFSFGALLHFYFMNALVYVDIDLGIHYVKILCR